MLCEVVLRMRGSDNDASGAIEPNVVFSLRVVEVHSLKGDANEVWVYCVERFSHVPGANTAAPSALLDFFLEVD